MRRDNALQGGGSGGLFWFVLVWFVLFCFVSRRARWGCGVWGLEAVCVSEVGGGGGKEMGGCGYDGSEVFAPALVIDSRHAFTFAFTFAFPSTFAFPATSTIQSTAHIYATFDSKPQDKVDMSDVQFE